MEPKLSLHIILNLRNIPNRNLFYIILLVEYHLIQLIIIQINVYPNLNRISNLSEYVNIMVL